ncbi:hypothetical protein QYE76_018035 [Lolium multiflorum]|uniref:Uncharacterized protein n=1 Tax=Lolium multiflorum TaxID=4521 RepID=A0AAD8QJF3_LOLMU|nr:hypothetical protein QYE76_018035 [Lolium multiflorum]
MESCDGDTRKKRKGTPAPPSRKRRKTTGAAPPLSLAPAPSMRMGPGDIDGGAPTPTSRRKPTGAAAPPSRPTVPPVRMAPGDGGAPTERRRKGSSSPREGKRGRRTGSERRSYIRNSPAGCPQKSDDDDSSESSAGEDDTCEDLTGHGDDPNASGAGGAGNTHGSPDAPSKNVATSGKIVVAHTPNTPPRFKGLLRTITSLIPCEHKGKSYECSSGRMNAFVRWSEAENALFFEWSDDKMEMTCWMHNIKKGQIFKFTVNAAFSHDMDNIIVERAAVAFSTNFIRDDEYWSDLKDTLLNTFGSFEDKGFKDYDYLYVFTRVGDSVCFRNFKITSLPKADDASSGLVLTEINTRFFLKLVRDQVNPNSSDLGPRHTQNQIPTELRLCPVILYSIPNGQMGSCLTHCVDFTGETYPILLENGPYVSSLEKLDGFNTSLAEIVVKEPLLKIKHIIGSTTDKTHCFARQRCKSILQSLFAELAILFESGKCISCPADISMHHVLVRANEVKLYGLPVTDYVEELAEENVISLVGMVKSCFPQGEIPTDLYGLLADLEKDPLNEIRTAKEDCSLLKAKDRRSLLININSEYMTNVPAKSDDDSDSKIDEFSFFDGCPDAKNWDLIIKDNVYLVQICNVENSSDEDTERMKQKGKIGKNTVSIRKMTKKKKVEANKGKLQFSSYTDFEMHMPVKARKDGIFPFRLGMADYILTAYFPGFLRFVQKRMREVKAEREKHCMQIEEDGKKLSSEHSTTERRHYIFRLKKTGKVEFCTIYNRNLGRQSNRTTFLKHAVSSA